MSIKVLIVDDSAFFRRLLSYFLRDEADIAIVGTAENGQEAIDQVERLRPDVITMDVDMPVMDGLQATRHIMAHCPTPILMLSALTTEGARATLSALDAGAMDFLPKRVDAITGDQRQARSLFCARVRALAMRNRHTQRSTPVTKVSLPTPVAVRDKRIVLIGASTGGPQALQNLLPVLPAHFPVPVIVVQHMPALFTASLAERLDQRCALRVKEAEHGETVGPGFVYIAPGGQQLLLKAETAGVSIQVVAAEPGQIYRPCVDATFFSAANVFKEQVLALILTGMGSDGCEGAQSLKRVGASVWAQDEASSVVYGMPMAVARAGLTDRVVSLNQLGPDLVKGFS